MIDFNKNAYYFGAVTQEDRDTAKLHEEWILEALNGDKDLRFQVGVHLIELFNSRAYIVISNGQGHAMFFWQFCEERFKMDKSTVSRYMNIVDEFGDGKIGLHKKWQAYSWSVLVEMIPMSPLARELIKPEMTCKQVRDLKRGLIATSQQEVKPDRKVTFTDTDRERIAAMKKIYGHMSTDELLLELYRLREDLMRYQAESEDAAENVVEENDFEVEDLDKIL